MRTASEALEGLLVRVDLDKDMPEFLARPGQYLASAIGIYANLLEANGVTSVHDLEKKWRDSVSCEDNLEEAVDDLWSVEDRWDQILKEVDVKAFGNGSQTSSPPLKMGDLLPKNLRLVEARKGFPISLEEVIGNQSANYCHLVLLRHLA